MSWAQKYAEIYFACLKVFYSRPVDKTKKQLGRYFRETDYPTVLWAMLNHHEFEWLIHKEVERALAS